jgi:hypothetical protein
MTEKKSKPAPGTCCTVLEMVLSREHPSDRAGLAIAMSFSAKECAYKPTLVVRFRKAKRGTKTEFAEATFAVVNVCPFCGAKTL